MSLPSQPNVKLVNDSGWSSALVSHQDCGRELQSSATRGRFGQRAAAPIEYPSDAISQPSPRAGVCCDIRGDFSAALASAATSLFLGRSGILRSGRARHFSLREPDSAFYDVECTPAAGPCLAGTVVEMRRLRASRDALGHAGDGGVLLARSIPPGEEA